MFGFDKKLVKMSCQEIVCTVQNFMEGLRRKARDDG